MQMKKHPFKVSIVITILDAMPSIMRVPNEYVYATVDVLIVFYNEVDELNGAIAIIGTLDFLPLKFVDTKTPSNFPYVVSNKIMTTCCERERTDASKALCCDIALIRIRNKVI